MLFVQVWVHAYICYEFTLLLHACVMLTYESLNIWKLKSYTNQHFTSLKTCFNWSLCVQLFHYNKIALCMTWNLMCYLTTSYNRIKSLNFKGLMKHLHDTIRSTHIRIALVIYSRPLSGWYLVNSDRLRSRVKYAIRCLSS